jgi:hypothetical protein
MITVNSYTGPSLGSSPELIINHAIIYWWKWNLAILPSQPWINYKSCNNLLMKMKLGNTAQSALNYYKSCNNLLMKMKLGNTAPSALNYYKSCNNLLMKMKLGNTTQFTSFPQSVISPTLNARSLDMKCHIQVPGNQFQHLPYPNYPHIYCGT